MLLVTTGSVIYSQTNTILSIMNNAPGSVGSIASLTTLAMRPFPA